MAQLVCTPFSPSVALTITESGPNENPAPYGAFFEATLFNSGLTAPAGSTVYDPDFLDPYYVWSSGDTSGASPVLENTLAAWNNKDVGYGPLFCHTYETPGTYTVTCTAYHPTTKAVMASNTRQITVTDPDTLYAGTRTRAVATDGNFTGKPTGAAEFTTLDAAMADLDGSAQTGRIVLKGGQTFTINTATDRVDSTYPNFRLGGYSGFGTGRPTITLSASSSGPTRDVSFAETKDFCVYGIDFAGGWDDETETGVSNDPFATTGGGAHGFNLLHNCTTTGQDLIGFQNGTSGTHIITDVAIDGFRNYGFLYDIENGRIGLKGVRVKRSSQARGGGFADKSGNAHGPFRWSGNTNNSTSKGYFGLLDWFSNAGWSGNSIDGFQPCWRTSGGGINNRLVFDRDVFEGGGNVVDRNSIPAEGSIYAPMNTLMDKVIMISTFGTRYHLETALGALVMRNVYGIHPSIKSTNSTNYRALVRYGDPVDPLTPFPNANAEPVRLFSSGLYSDQIAANEGPSTLSFVSGTGSFTTETRDNNTQYCPNVTNPLTADAPFISSVSGITPRSQSAPITVLNYDAETGAFTAGLTVTNGSTFSAKILKVFDNGTTGTLYLYDVTAGDYADNQTITDTSTGSATSNGALTPGNDYTYGTPTHKLDYDAETGTFTAGVAVSNGGTFSARIVRVDDNGTTGTLWLTAVTAGNLADNDTITDTGGGSATANGVLQNTFATLLFKPDTGSAAIGDTLTGFVAREDLNTATRGTPADRGPVEA